MPTEETTYRQGQDERMKRFEIDMRGSQTRQELGLAELKSELQKGMENLDAKVSYTNGKIRKIIIALAVLGGILLGELFNLKEIISLLIGTFK